MSYIRRKSIIRRFSVSLAPGIKINPQYIYEYRNYSPIKNKSTSNKIVNNLNRRNNYKVNKYAQSSFMSLLRKKKLEENKYNSEFKFKYNSIMKKIKTQFIKKYSKIYYGNSNNYNSTKYLLYNYYKINNILNNKRCHLTLLVKEYNIFYNNIEYIERYYQPKERYIIMKYLLNFIYKYDELTFEIYKEIKSKQKKQELINNFFYISSKQYLYEHLLESDAFKGIKYLLKRINLANKKAQYDYYYLDMAKSQMLSEENKFIINSIKALNEYMNNRKYLEKKLMKNIPYEKVPNCVPNYYVLGYELNLSLKDYKFLKKHKKIGKPGNETIGLIHKAEQEYSKSNINDNNNIVTDQNKILFNIIERITESDSSDFDEEKENNYFEIKKPKKKKKSIINYDFYNILPSYLYKNDNEINIKKAYLRKITSDNIMDYKSLYEISKSPKSEKRLPNDPEIIDIEKFLNVLQKNKSIISFYKKSTKKSFSLRMKNNYRYKKELEIENVYDKNDNKSLNDSFTDKSTKQLFDKNKKEQKSSLNNNSKMKINSISPKLKNNNSTKKKFNSPKNSKIKQFEKLKLLMNKEKYKKRNSLQKKNVTDKFKNENILFVSSKSNYSFGSPKLNQKKIDKYFFKKNNLKPLLLYSSDNNNNSSTIFSERNNLNKNLFSTKILKNENEKNISSNEKNNIKNITLSINNNNNLNKININKKGINKKYIFKDTKDFIKGAKEYYNKIKIKPKLLFKNLSLYNYNMRSEKNSKKDMYPYKKRIFSSNTPRLKIKNHYLNNNESNNIINNISNYIKKQLKKSKEKENKSITSRQMIKNSEIYFFELDKKFLEN